MYEMPKLMDPQRMDGPGLVARLDELQALWCDFDKKLDNHTTKECYNNIRFVRNQQMVGGMQNYVPSGERPWPVLDAQPPLPNVAHVRLVKHEDEDNQEQALYELSQILQVDNEARCKFERTASLATFKFWGLGQMPRMWKSNHNKDMTCDQLFG